MEDGMIFHCSACNCELSHTYNGFTAGGAGPFHKVQPCQCQDAGQMRAAIESAMAMLREYQRLACQDFPGNEHWAKRWLPVFDGLGASVGQAPMRAPGLGDKEG